MTPRQEKFVQEYLLDLNATQAAIRAGYSAKTANAIAGRLLVNVSIQKEIQKKFEDRSKRTEITADETLKQLAIISFGSMKDVATWGPDGVTLKNSEELSDEQAFLISEISENATESSKNIRVKIKDQLKALEMLARHLGMFTDKFQVEVKAEQPQADLSTLSDEQLDFLLEKSLGYAPERKPKSPKIIGVPDGLLDKKK